MALRSVRPRDVLTVRDLIFDVYQNVGSVFVIGNGGSAATASHFAIHLQQTRRPFKILSLVDNVPAISAIANDTAFSRVFRDQLARMMEPRDLVVALSVSGMSPNIVEAVSFAKELGAKSVGITGGNENDLARRADFSIGVSSSNPSVVETVHLAIAHAVACVP